MATVSPEDFAPPGEGLWAYDPQHFPRPVSRLLQEVQAPAVAKGGEEAARRYGTFRGAARTAYVLRFRYLQPQPLIPRPSGAEAEARAAYARLVESSSEAQQRIRAAERVFTTRLWREDVRRWDSEEKPIAVARTRALAGVDVETLGAEELAEHLDDCLDQLAETNRRHHRFNPTWGVPLGEFVSSILAWTGLDAGRALALLRGSSPISAGRSPQLDALAAALRDDPDARRAIDSTADPGAAIASLRARFGSVGAAARAFFEVHGYACTAGFDPVDDYALERPDAMLDRVRAAVVDEDQFGADPEVQEAISDARKLVPLEHRAAFDELLTEARYCYRIKDERGLYNDMPARGLTRRAVLEGGRRLHSSGRLVEAEHLLDAGRSEVDALLRGQEGPSAEELRERYDYRIANGDATPPLTLGKADGLPVPLEWLPPPVQRVERALLASGAAATGAPLEELRTSVERALRGVPASPGVYEGVARVVLAPDDFQRIQRGDVLVTSATSPAISAWTPLLGAIVTDRGGPLSHAAIVARECALPAVVGTTAGTTTFEDGHIVRVDGGTGVVTQLG